MSEYCTYYVGIDWGRKFHQVCVLDREGQRIAQRNFQHQAEPVCEMARWLLERVEHKVEHLKVGLEIPTGSLVCALQSFGLTLWSINPKQSSRFRDRFSVAGAKDDQRDAQVIASALRTDSHAFREVPALIEEQRTMRCLVHCRERLIQQKVKLSNQLKELISDYFPALFEATENMAENWFLSLLQQAPTPHQAQKLTRGKLQKLLKEHRIRRLDAAELQRILRQPVFPGVDPMAPPEAIEVTILVSQLQLLLSQIKDVERQMDALMQRWERTQTATPTHESDSDSVRDVDILRSLPGVGRCVSTALLSEAATALEQRDYRALRTLSGVAPVTQRSGKKRIVCQRRAVNVLMQNALYHWTRIACQHDAVCKQKYHSLRARGKTRGQALRCVGDRLLKVLCTMLENNTLYEPRPPKIDCAA